MDEIERKLAQAMQLITEVGAMLAESKRAQQPAQVMSRIQAAQGAARTPSLVPPLSVVRKAVAPGKERAHFYLRIAAANDPTNDKIFRVLGDEGLLEANRMQAELKGDPSYKTERLDSRAWDALKLGRIRMIREGADYHVGSTSAEDLRGPGAVKQ